MRVHLGAQNLEGLRGFLASGLRRLQGWVPYGVGASAVGGGLAGDGLSQGLGFRI